ncbi:hypothetical protein VP01_11414g1, partial [Puccinia sorghi]
GIFVALVARGIRFLASKISKNHSSRLFNPFLKLMGTKVYLFKDFMSQIPNKKLVEVEARWRTFNTDTPNIPPFQPKFI